MNTQEITTKIVEKLIQKTKDDEIKWETLKRSIRIFGKNYSYHDFVITDEENDIVVRFYYRGVCIYDLPSELLAELLSQIEKNKSRNFDRGLEGELRKLDVSTPIYDWYRKNIL